MPSSAKVPAPRRERRPPRLIRRDEAAQVSLKTECLRISEYGIPAEPRRLIAGYVEQYNNDRLHQSLGYDTPADWYCSEPMAAQAVTSKNAGSLPSRDSVSK